MARIQSTGTKAHASQVKPGANTGFEDGIRETCQIRRWDLWAINVRTNHIHAVVSVNCKPQNVLTAFKANATRKLREAGYWHCSGSPWAEGGSKRYLWTEEEVNDAVAYVQYVQGEPLV